MVISCTCTTNMIVRLYLSPMDLNINILNIKIIEKYLNSSLCIIRKGLNELASVA